MDKSIVVPIGLFVSVVYTIKLLVDARMRYLLFRAGAPDTVQALFEGEEQLRRMGSLRAGTVLVGLALGLAVASAQGWALTTLPGLAVLLGAWGVALLVGVGVAMALDRRRVAAEPPAPPPQ